MLVVEVGTIQTEHQAIHNQLETVLVKNCQKIVHINLVLNREAIVHINLVLNREAVVHINLVLNREAIVHINLVLNREAISSQGFNCFNPLNCPRMLRRGMLTQILTLV